MPLSLQQREFVPARTEDRVVGRNIPRQITRAAVERVCSIFSMSVDRVAEPAGGGEIFETLCTASMPDLASRVCRQTMATGFTPTRPENGSLGRPTTTVTRLATARAPERWRTAVIVGCNTGVAPGTV
jgi:hypothetical protein